MKSFTLHRALLGAAAAAAALPASAADVEPLRLEDVVVTAQRREARLQDVPGAVSAFSAGDLERLGASHLGDIQAAVPGLTLHMGDAKNAVVYIRGVGQIDSLAFADPGVGIYVDDVYLGRAQGAFLDVMDVARIEVLRGPQGTLYGRNTIGGAIKYVSVEPGREPLLRLDAGVGSYQRRDLKMTANLPLGTDWALRTSLASLQRDGYATNSVDGRDDGDQDTLAWRVALEGRLAEDLDLSLAVDRSRNTPRTSRTPARLTPVFGVVPPGTDPFAVDADFNGRDDLDVRGASSTLTWAATDALVLTSITAYREMQYDAELDLDATAFAFFGVYDDEAQKQVSQELQLAIDGERLSGVAGLYYFREHDVTVSGLYGPAIALVTGSVNDQTNRSIAAYGQVAWEFTDRWSTTLGLRYTREQKDFARTQEFFAGTTRFPPPLGKGLQVTNIDTGAEWSNWSPHVGVQYRWSPDLMAYAQASRGYKSGGFDGRSNTAAQAVPYEPEDLWAYEAGIKSVLGDGRVTLNVAAFYDDYKNLQLSSFVADARGQFAALFTNAGAATLQGVDVELQARVSPAFSLQAALGLLDARYDRYVGPGGADISDRRELVNAPRVTGSLGVVLQRPLGGGALSFQPQWAYRAKTYPTVSSSEVLAQDAYSLLNATLAWETDDGRWRVALTGRNLGDKRYVTHGFDLSDSLGYQLGYYGEPRQYQFTLRRQF